MSPSCTTPVVTKPIALAPHAQHAHAQHIKPQILPPSWQQRLAAGTLAACVLACAPTPPTLADVHPQPIVSHLAAAPQLSFEISVDGQSIGRVTVALFDDVPVGTARFAQLAEGLDGASYRRSKFNEIYPEYIRNAGVKNLTYRADAQVRLAGGADTFALETELTEHRHQHDQAGVVSLVVRDAEQREVKEKLVAYQGKLVNVQVCVLHCGCVGVAEHLFMAQEVMGEAPNGTAFVITRAPAPALDATNLPIGRVVAGQDVVEAIGQLPVVKDNSDSPFFKAGKVLGDRRADVAERSFNRPFNRVVVAAVSPE